LKPQVVTKTSVNFLGSRKEMPPSRMHLFVGSKRLKEDVSRIIKMVTQARTKGGTLGNIVFYGPPGTGKTMMAEEIAIRSGMDYAIFSAGDFGKLTPEDQKIQLEKLFGWSERLVKQGRSLVIFIDEAEEFLRDRRLGNAREGLLSMFLNRVPEQRSKNLMFIFATNFLKQLDGAVLSRIDEAIPFSKPGQQERQHMMVNYLKDLVQKFVGKKGERIAITQETIDKIATTFSRDEYTKGFAGRTIAGMIALLQDVGLTKGSVTFEDAKPVLEHKIEREKYLAAIEQEKQRKSNFEGYVGSSEEEIHEGIAAAEKESAAQKQVAP
jgi:AAA+ superfamily predicted ATPase